MQFCDPLNYLARFGLHLSQIRAREFFGHNAIWYDGNGNRVGLGDLDADDVRRIIDGLANDECFITVAESAFEVGRLVSVTPEQLAPAARFVFTASGAFAVSPFTPAANCVDGVAYSTVTPSAVQGMLRRLAAAAA